MADKPILNIPVNVSDSDFDKFLQKFAKYKSDLEETATLWAQIGKSLGGITIPQGVSVPGSTGGGAAGGGAGGPAVPGISPSSPGGVVVTGGGISLTNRRTTNPVKQVEAIEKHSKSTEKHWAKIARHMRQSSQFMSGMVRSSISLGTTPALLGSLGAVGGFGSALFAGSVFSASDLAKQNYINKSLGLAPGEAQAFGIQYAKVGGSQGMLENVASAQGDVRQWAKLRAAGISLQDIQSASPAQLSEQLLKNIGERYRQMGPGRLGAFLGATGLDSLVNVNQARAASKYSESDFEDMHKAYEQSVKDLAVHQDALDKSTKALADFEDALQQDKNMLEEAFTDLYPLFTHMAKSVAESVAAFARSPELKEDINDIITAFSKFEKAVEWISNKLKPEATTQVQLGSGLIDAFNAAKGGNWGKVWGILNTPLNGPQNSTTPNPKTPGQQPTGTFVPDKNKAGDFTDLEKKYGLRPGILGALEGIESSGGNPNKLVGPMTKYGWRAMGPFQHSPDIIRQYKEDPFNEQQEALTTAQELARLMKEFGGDEQKAVAAYNWGEGNVKKTVQFSQKTNSDWRQHLPADVKSYLNTEQRVVDNVNNPGRAGAPAIGSPTRSGPVQVNVDVRTIPGTDATVSVGGLPR